MYKYAAVYNLLVTTTWQLYDSDDWYATDVWRKHVPLQWQKYAAEFMQFWVPIDKGLLPAEVNQKYRKLLASYATGDLLGDLYHTLHPRLLTVN